MICCFLWEDQFHPGFYDSLFLSKFSQPSLAGSLTIKQDLSFPWSLHPLCGIGHKDAKKSLEAPQGAGLKSGCVGFLHAYPCASLLIPSDRLYCPPPFILKEEIDAHGKDTSNILKGYQVISNSPSLICPQFLCLQLLPVFHAS